MAEKKWVSDRLTVVLFGKICRKEGRSYNGLGMIRMIDAIPEFQVPVTEMVFHLGTGHGFCALKGSPAEIVEVGTQLAELGDWTFDSLAGWKNQFPDVTEKLLNLRDRYPLVVVPMEGDEDEDLARKIALARC
ncbi:hypothetical protein [uncultured Brevundimonas sp.]|uniref:hypothetical protein n=1 Tax=uncultured Brevundimonas sp. TaxID=213418 RepID=UPI002613A643|nr:hypothetical protein [uncultured Brevundimonas sp.]